MPIRESVRVAEGTDHDNEKADIHEQNQQTGEILVQLFDEDDEYCYDAEEGGDAEAGEPGNPIGLALSHKL